MIPGNGPGHPEHWTRRREPAVHTTGSGTGTVKWFSQQKGYGFLAEPDGTERFFSAGAVIGQAPQAGDQVSFRPAVGPKGPRAEAVSVIAKRSRQDDRVTCRSCGRKMVPRMTFYRGAPQTSHCPFCAAIYRDFRPGCLDYIQSAFVLLIVIIGALFLMSL